MTNKTKAAAHVVAAMMKFEGKMHTARERGDSEKDGSGECRSLKWVFV